MHQLHNVHFQLVLSANFGGSYFWRVLILELLLLPHEHSITNVLQQYLFKIWLFYYMDFLASFKKGGFLLVINVNDIRILYPVCGLAKIFTI